MKVRPEAIIVLGAAHYDGRPSRILIARLEEALAQARMLGDAAVPLITVGGNLPGDRFTEAAVAKAYLEEHAPGTRVIAVETGSDTVESLRAVHDCLPYRRVIIVTDPLHRLRARLIAGRVGFQARVVGARGYPTPTFAPAWWRYLAHEAGGLVVFAVARLVGERAAGSVRSGLHYVEGFIRPSRKARHEVLRSHQHKGE